MGRRRRMRRTMRHERKINHRQWYADVGNFDVQNLSLSEGVTHANMVKVKVQALRGEDCTILRSRGVFATGFASGGVELAAVLGATVLPNRTANQASVSDLPNPMIDAESNDWFVWYPFVIPENVDNAGAATADVVEAVAMSQNNVPIDSKAKRILEANESVVWVCAFSPQSAVSDFDASFTYALRTLVGY